MPFRLSLFGSPRLLDAESNVVPVPEKTFAIAAFLLLGCRSGLGTRAQIRQFLWENADAATASTNLRKLLARIRSRQSEADFQLIRISRNHVELAPTVEIDLSRLRQLLASRDSSDIVELCDLYSGELLEGAESEESEFREWLEVQRTLVRDTWISAVAGRLEPAAASDRTAVRVAARRLLEVDAYNEVAYRALMRLHAADNEPARVRDAYRTLESRLREELGVAPDSATTDLYRSLLPHNPARPSASILRAPPPDGRFAEEPGFAPPAAIPPNRTGVPRVTVLPPPPVGGQNYHHQLAVALIEDVTIGLCRFKGLSVVAPHTALQLRDNSKRALFRTFGIDYAAETHLRNIGGEYSLSVRLIDAESREILWTTQLPFDQTRVAKDYRDLSSRIVVSLVDKIERTELAHYDVEQNATAYHLYLVGQKNLRTLDLPHIRRARRAFKDAVGSFPDFVPALSGLARTYQIEWLLMARGDSSLLVEAKRLASQAVEIDPDDARGYRELGVCGLYTGAFEESVELLHQAEERNPQFADLLNDFADALTHACDFPTALQKINLAIELNPLCPDQYWWAAAGVNYYLEQYGQAIGCMSRMRDQSPAFRLLAASWAMLGDRERAGEYVARTKEIHPDFSVSGWMSIVPIRDPRHASHYERGLREAGFT